MIYSQYIDGGVIPLALALEEMGFSRHGINNETQNLFKNHCQRDLQTKASNR